MNRTQHKQWRSCKYSQMHGRGGQEFFLLPLPCDCLGIRKKESRHCFGYHQLLLWSRQGRGIFWFRGGKGHRAVSLNRNTRALWINWVTETYGRLQEERKGKRVKQFRRMCGASCAQSATCQIQVRWRTRVHLEGIWKGFLGEVAKILKLEVFVIKFQVLELTGRPISPCPSCFTRQWAWLSLVLPLL